MSRHLKLTEYEELIFAIIFNAQEKLIASIKLFKLGISFSTAYFLAIIAEEEIAKLILLPIAKELGEIDDLITDRKSSYFNHKIKQRIFSSYGLQNRSHEDIENLKQSCLYIGKGQKSTYIKPDIVYEELKHALKLYSRFVIEISVTGTHFSDDFKEAVTTLTRLTLRDCIKHEIPQLIDDVFTEDDKNDSEDGLVELKYEDYFSNPYLLIEILKSVIGDRYRQFLRETKDMSFDNMVQHLRDNLGIKYKPNKVRG